MRVGKSLVGVTLVALGVAVLLSACGNRDMPSDSGPGSNNPACGRCEAPAAIDLANPTV